MIPIGIILEKQECFAEIPSQYVLPTRKLRLQNVCAVWFTESLIVLNSDLFSFEQNSNLIWRNFYYNVNKITQSFDQSSSL